MKKLFKKRKKDAKIPSRITNETVAEHRERILAGGRRFKYPMQYARHRLVINTIIIAIVTILLLVLLIWQQLYMAQNTSSFFYRITRVIPVPVASVDGEWARYSDYLMQYNSTAHYLREKEQIDLGSQDGQRQLDYMKRRSMDNAVASAYARKLAREGNIIVSDEQIDDVIAQGRNTTNGEISQDVYNASIRDLFGWEPDESRASIRDNLVRQEVSYAIDDKARVLRDEAATLVNDEDDPDFDVIARKLEGEGSVQATAGASGLVPRTNRDGGLSQAAAELEEGDVSSAIRTTTGDGYYFVKLIEKNDTQVSYSFLRIPLTVFNERLAALKENGGITEYIDVPSVDVQNGPVQSEAPAPTPAPGN